MQMQDNRASLGGVTGIPSFQPSLDVHRNKGERSIETSSGARAPPLNQFQPQTRKLVRSWGRVADEHAVAFSFDFESTCPAQC
jgi:hypothetical protein